MGEAKFNRLKHATLRSGEMTCIYCGIAPATTVDHMPPRMVFDNKQRPDVLVFPACKACNEATRKNDAIISWFSRLYYGLGKDNISPEFEQLTKGMQRYPDLTREFSRGERIPYIKNESGLVVPSNLVRVNIGPITQAALEQFALKFIMAMHWHVSGEIVPGNVPMFVMGATNHDIMITPAVQQMIAAFQAREVMRQGIMTSAGQFSYQSVYVDETRESVFYGGFRESFAVFGQVRPALLSMLPPQSIRYGRDLLRPYPYLEAVAPE